MIAPPDFDRARRVAAGVRRHALEIADRHDGGYLAQACSAAEILACLYVILMDLGPPAAGPLTVDDPSGSIRPRLWGGDFNGIADPSRDRFVLSPAHYATALYATLVETGRLRADALDGFGVDGSTLEMIGAEYSPGFEVTTGSLAQGLSVAVGAALARRRRGDRGRIWVLLSDGELQEGQTWEAIGVAAAFRLDNLAVFVDANDYQVDGPIDPSMAVDTISPKVAAFGWSVTEVDGHDVAALAAAPDRWEAGRPLFVVCRTRPWQGLPNLRGRDPGRLHFVRFRDGESAAAWRDLARWSEAPA